MVFGTLPSFLEPSTTKRNQIERLNAVSLAQAEMETIVDQRRIRATLRSKIPGQKCISYHQVMMYECPEKKKLWDGKVKFTKVSDKLMSVTDGQR